jgi:XTP/dITP diphosphohydrolase
MNVAFITNNDLKFEIAKLELLGTNVELEMREVDVPDIQSDSIEDVISFKAKFAADVLEKPVCVLDSAYYITTLKGFPGPFIKYVNQWFTAEDFLNLMKGKDDRSVDIIECLACCEPGKKPMTFVCVVRGKIAEKAGLEGWSPINQVFIPEGYDTVLTEIPKDELSKFFNLPWKKFREYLMAGKTIS